MKTGAVPGGSFPLDWRFPKGKTGTRVCACVCVCRRGRLLGGSRKVRGSGPFLRSNCQGHLRSGTSARTLPGSWEQGVVLRSVGPQSKPRYPPVLPHPQPAQGPPQTSPQSFAKGFVPKEGNCRVAFCTKCQKTQASCPLPSAQALP